MPTLLGKKLSLDPTCAKRGTLMFSGCRADGSTLSARVEPHHTAGGIGMTYQRLHVRAQCEDISLPESTQCVTQ